MKLTKEQFTSLYGMSIIRRNSLNNESHNLQYTQSRQDTCNSQSQRNILTRGRDNTFTKALEIKLLPYTADTFCNSQCGFKKNRSTTQLKYFERI
jgi:hypothetical protein